MTTEELERIALDGESGKVEFKMSTGQLERGMETVCAFLNDHAATMPWMPVDVCGDVLWSNRCHMLNLEGYHAD